MMEMKSHSPQWLPLVNLFAQGEVGQTFTYDQLNKAVNSLFGPDERALHIDLRDNRSALYSAKVRLEEGYKRTIINVPTVGYRIAEAVEHHTVGLKHQKKAKRSVRRGKHTVDNVDRSQLSALESQRMDELSAQLGRHETMLANHGSRITALESAQSITVAEQRRQAGELARLKAGLRARGLDPKALAGDVPGGVPV